VAISGKTGVTIQDTDSAVPEITIGDGTGLALTRISSLSTVAGAGNLEIGQVVVAGAAQAVALATMAATDIVVAIPMTDPAAAVPAAGDSWWITITPLTSFTINLSQAPAAPCTFAYIVIHKGA